METQPSQWTCFDPPRRKGAVINLTALFLDLATVISLLVFAVGQPPGLVIVLSLISALLLSLPLPILLYRLYSLWLSGYWVGRNGVRLRWGLRQVDLPYEAIADVARAVELEQTLPVPHLTWPGSVVGQTRSADLGSVEFLAADVNKLVLIGTNEKVFAISPHEDEEFVRAYKLESERGSLKPLTARSVKPIFVLTEVWAESQPRLLFILGGTLALGLLVLVSILAPGGPISLGFSGSGQPLPAVAGVQLFLLPTLNLFFYMGNFILGLLFYQEPSGRQVSLLLWGCSLVTGVFYLGAVIFSLVTRTV